MSQIYWLVQLVAAYPKMDLGELDITSEDAEFDFDDFDGPFYCSDATVSLSNLICTELVWVFIL